MRLQKYIALSGYASRRKAEELIKQKRVKVNNEIVDQMGVSVSENDVVSVDGKELKMTEKKVYFLLNKPRGVICSSNDEKNRQTVVDLINCDERIYSVGRLDYDTTGVLILTNDGDLTNLLTHPKNEIEKTYLAKIEGILSKEDIFKLKNNISIEGRKVIISHLKVRKTDYVKNDSLVEISIVEGRNHIVKKIFSSLNHEVIKLSRIRYAFLDVGNLKSGEYRELSLKEVKKLYSLK